SAREDFITNDDQTKLAMRHAEWLLVNQMGPLQTRSGLRNDGSGAMPPDYSVQRPVPKKPAGTATWAGRDSTAPAAGRSASTMRCAGTTNNAARCRWHVQSG